MAKYITLSETKQTIVNEEDYEKLKDYNWCFEGRYAYRRNKGKKIYLHREVMGFPKKGEIDHINQDKLDNRRENLRLVSRSQNMSNANQSHKNATSKYRGVYWVKGRENWRVAVKKNGKKHHVGEFKCEIEAAKAYNKAAKKYHKHFAVLNDV